MLSTGTFHLGRPVIELVQPLTDNHEARLWRAACAYKRTMHTCTSLVRGTPLSRFLGTSQLKAAVQTCMQSILRSSHDGHQTDLHSTESMLSLRNVIIHPQCTTLDRKHKSESEGNNWLSNLHVTGAFIAICWRRHNLTARAHVQRLVDVEVAVKAI